MREHVLHTPYKRYAAVRSPSSARLTTDIASTLTRNRTRACSPVLWRGRGRPARRARVRAIGVTRRWQVDRLWSRLNSGSDPWRSGIRFGGSRALGWDDEPEHRSQVVDQRDISRQPFCNYSGASRQGVHGRAGREAGVHQFQGAVAVADDEHRRGEICQQSMLAGFVGNEHRRAGKSNLTACLFSRLLQHRQNVSAAYPRAERSVVCAPAYTADEQSKALKARRSPNSRAWRASAMEQWVAVPATAMAVVRWNCLSVSTTLRSP